MVNTKGGFLVDEDGGPGKEVDEEVQRREKLREKERIAKNAEPCGFTPYPSVSLNSYFCSSTVGCGAESQMSRVRYPGHRPCLQSGFSLSCL